MIWEVGSLVIVAVVAVIGMRAAYRLGRHHGVIEGRKQGRRMERDQMKSQWMDRQIARLIEEEADL